MKTFKHLTKAQVLNLRLEMVNCGHSECSKTVSANLSWEKGLVLNWSFEKNGTVYNYMESLTRHQILRYKSKAFSFVRHLINCGNEKVKVIETEASDEISKKHMAWHGALPDSLAELKCVLEW